MTILSGTDESIMRAGFLLIMVLGMLS